MGGSSLLHTDVPVPVSLVVLAPAWPAALLAMGFLQWRVLHRTVARSTRWIWVNAGAWLVGVMIPVVALSVVPNGSPVWVYAVVGVLAAVAMGAAVGAITGRTLERLLATEALADRSPSDDELVLPRPS